MARRSGQRAIELRTLHDAIRFGDRTSLQREVDLASEMGGRLAPVYAAHAAALANRDAAAVYEAAEKFEQIGALLRPPTPPPRRQFYSMPPVIGAAR